MISDTGTIPAYTYEKLARPWDALCGNDTGVVLVNDFGENDEKFCPEKYLRFTERARYSSLLRVGGVTKEIGEKNKFHFEIIMDLRPFTKASAVRNIIQTIFICLVLGNTWERKKIGKILYFFLYRWRRIVLLKRCK